MEFVPCEFLLIRVFRVRAPGGALEGTVFEDLSALGTVLFLRVPTSSANTNNPGFAEPCSHERGKPGLFVFIARQRGMSGEAANGRAGHQGESFGARFVAEWSQDCRSGNKYGIKRKG